MEKVIGAKRYQKEVIDYKVMLFYNVSICCRILFYGTLIKFQKGMCRNRDALR